MKGQQKPKKLAKKVKTGKGFDLEDFKAQMLQMNKMGGLGALMDKLPAQLTQLLKQVRGKDKSTYKIIKQKCDALRAEEQRVAQIDRAVAAGLPLYLQAAARGIGVILGLEASFVQFATAAKSVVAERPQRDAPGDRRDEDVEAIAQAGTLAHAGGVADHRHRQPQVRCARCRRGHAARNAPNAPSRCTRGVIASSTGRTRRNVASSPLANTEAARAAMQNLVCKNGHEYGVRHRHQAHQPEQ